jgi:lipopolysaccharide exporter
MVASKSGHPSRMNATQPDTPETPSHLLASEPAPESLTSRAVTSFAWSAVSFGGGKLVVFISTVVLARLLTPGDFGIVAAAMALLLFFDVVLDLGLGAALVYEQESGVSDRAQTAFTLSLIMSFSLAVLGVLITPLVAQFFGLQSHEDVFRVLFVYLFVRGSGQVQNSILQRDLRFGRRATVELSRAIVRTVVSIALAVAGFGVWSLVLGLLVGELVGTALAWWAVGAWPRLSFDRAVVRALMGFGLTYILLKVVDAIGLDSDYLVVGHKLGATQLGYYSMGYRLPELALLSLYWIFGAVAFPIYSKARVEGTQDPAAAMLRVLRLITLFSFPAGILLALMARDVIMVIFGAKWAPAVGPMVLISLMTSVAAVGIASGDLFPASGRPGALLVLNVPFTIILVIGFIIAAPYGIVAVAIVHLVMTVIAQSVRLLYVNRLFGTRIAQELDALRPAACASVGLLLLAVPVRLLIPNGPLALVLLGLTGLLGALGGLLVGSRDTVAELRSLAESVRASKTSASDVTT